MSSDDEPFSQYGLVAETIEMPADRSWVAFTLRPQARFHDGSPITVEDVIWTFDALKTKGRPFYRSYYAQVTKAEKVGDRKVRFSFAPGDNRELPLIVGQLPVLSRDVLEQAGLREDDARAAARQRGVPGRVPRCRPLHHLPPGEGLLGRRSCR